MSAVLRRLMKHAPAVLGVALFVGAIYVVQKEFRTLKIADIQKALGDIPTSALVISFGWNLLAYFILTFYDRLATVYAGRVVSFGKVAFASFCAYTLAHNLGVAAVSGAAVRYRLYAGWGLTPLQIGKVVVFCSLTFSFGGLVLGGSILFFEPEAIPFFGNHLPHWVMYAIAIGMWITVTAYIVLSRVIGTVTLFGHVIELPSWRMAFLQVILATVDVGVTAAIMYALLPEAAGLTYPKFLGIYLASYTAGLIANLPGGLGVFDAAMLLGLSPYLEPPVIAGGIVVFRLYYYIIPLFLAGAMFAGNEVLLRSKGVMRFAADKPSVQAIGRWSKPDFVVAASAGAVALCGGLLMAIGLIDSATDAPHWPDWLSWVTDQLDEFAPSLLGAALLVFAAALTQRVKLAWRGSLIVLVAGAVYGVAYGTALWVPGVLLVTAGLLAPFPGAFYRNASVFTGKLRAGTMLPLLALILCVIALGGFEPRLRELDNNSFWEAILSPEVPRIIRASVAACVGLGLFALWRLLRAGRTVFSPFDDAAADELRAMGGHPPREADGVIYGEAGRAAFAFRRIDGVLLAFGDPVGDAADRVSAVWLLRDLAREEGLDPAIWRAGRDLLGVYGDIGLAALPLDAAGIPIGDAEDAPGPHASAFLVCQAERDISALLPLLPSLARG